MTKYISENGVRKYNPAWKEEPEIALPPFVNQATALPIVSSPHQEGFFEEEVVVAPSYQQAVQQYEEEIDLSGGNALSELSSVLAKYEVPECMLSKLLTLQQFDLGEIIVDDSGSMRSITDTKGPKWRTNRSMDRSQIERVTYV